MHCLPTSPFAFLLYLGIYTPLRGGAAGATRQPSFANSPYSLFHAIRSVQSVQPFAICFIRHNLCIQSVRYTQKTPKQITKKPSKHKISSVRLGKPIQAQQTCGTPIQAQQTRHLALLSDCLLTCATLYPAQAMRDTELEKAVQRCCMLIGCFVPLQEYLPLLLTQLHTAADTAAEGAVIAALTALAQGAGKPTSGSYG